ncbi:MAG: hypothetical protein KGD65_12860, partial [Candidatus Lokiarchaeota archaeon]|nr:hypothetical protein [Candidatus Lokiarchaeota archaeon]
MVTHGIKDKVAVIGCDATKYGELWDKSKEDLLFESTQGAIKDAGIKCYIIAGSHDYSVSGKTFLDVLEKAGFCEICKYEETNDEIILKPCIFQSTYIYG